MNQEPTPNNAADGLEIRLARTLVELGGRLIAAQTVSEAANETAYAADRLLGWDACYVALFNEADQTSRLLFMADCVEGVRRELVEEYGHVWPASTVFLHALKNGPLVMDLATIKRLQQNFASFGDKSRHTESLLYVPIRDRNLRHIGMISLQRYAPGAYTEADLAPAQCLGDLAAHALVRLELEDSLSKQDSLLEMAVSELPAILWTTDRDLVFTSSMGAGLRELGLSPGQVVGMKVADYVRETGGNYVVKLHERALAGEQISYDTQTMGRAYHMVVRPFRNSAGEIIGTIGVATDGTELHRAEQAKRELELRMLQTQKLESLGVLAGGISHDFNNLLVGILGNASLALDELPEGHPARESINLVLQTGGKMRELTRQLLAYSGRGRFLNRSLDLNSILRDTNELLQSSISKRADFSVELSDDQLPVRGDQTQLRQMILNLASNASESLEDGVGRIAIRTRRGNLRPADLPTLVELPSSTAGEFVILEVEDTGSGIQPENLTRIMDPFFTTKAHGRGLGMAAVQGIIRSHGGGLQIVSTPRLGTTVRAYLPVNESDLTHHDVRPGKKYRGTVLVAEDEPVVRRFMADVLTREGLQVITADNGETAYTAFKERATEINLVVLDIVMPRQSGAEAYIQMARLRPNLPALFVSGASDEDLTRKGLQVTPQNFLAKPFTREALVAKLKAFF